MPWLVVGLVGPTIAACGASDAQRCADDTFCPADTVCGATGRCLVTAGACAAFAENAPCQGTEPVSFCTADECEGAVSITGQVLELRGEDIVGGQVEGLERPWMDPVDIAVGAFVVPAVRNDTDLVLRIESEGLQPLLTRRLTLTDADFVINEDPNEPLRMVSAEGHQVFTERIGETYDPANGLVVLRLFGAPPDEALPGATAALVDGPDSPRALYFTNGALGNPAQPATSSASGLVVFPNVVPGDYRVEITPSEARSCRAAGDVLAVSISAPVEAATVTNIGTIFCEP